MANGETPATAGRQKPLLHPIVYVILLGAFVVWALMAIGVIKWFVPVGNWLILLVLMVAFLALIGHRITKGQRWAGALIDTRNRFSLSRLQIILWTVLALSAYLTIALPRIVGGLNPDNDNQLKSKCEQRVTDAAKADGTTNADAIKALVDEQCVPTPLNITFPPELLLAMGISAASFAGSTLVQSTKKSKQVNVETRNAELGAADKAVKDAETELNNAKTDLKTKSDDLAVLQSQLTEAKAALESSGQEDLQAALKQAEAVLQQRTAAVEAQTKAVNAAEEKLQAASASEQATVRRELDTARALLAAAQNEAAQANAAWEAAKAKLTDQTEARRNVLVAQGLVTTVEQDVNRATDRLRKAEEQLANAQKRQQEVQDKYDKTEGLLHRNSSIAEADWVDLFRGEEIGNYQLVDVSKVQMFFFTVVLVFAYGVAVGQLLQNADAIQNPYWVDLPAFSSSLNALLGISHGAYLSVKTVDHTKTN